MSRFHEIAALLFRGPSEKYRARRMGVGLGVAAGFFIAFVAYSLTTSLW